MPHPWCVQWQRELFLALCGAFFGVGVCWISDLNWFPELHNSRIPCEERAKSHAGLGGVGTPPHQQ